MRGSLADRPATTCAAPRAHDGVSRAGHGSPRAVERRPGDAYAVVSPANRCRGRRPTDGSVGNFGRMTASSRPFAERERADLRRPARRPGPTRPRCCEGWTTARPRRAPRASATAGRTPAGVGIERRSPARPARRAGAHRLERRLRDSTPYADVVARVRSGPPLLVPAGLAAGRPGVQHRRVRRSTTRTSAARSPAGRRGHCRRARTQDWRSATRRSPALRPPRRRSPRRVGAAPGAPTSHRSPRRGSATAGADR